MSDSVQDLNKKIIEAFRLSLEWAFAALRTEFRINDNSDPLPEDLAVLQNPPPPPTI